jgi:hypothetical protein
MNFVAPTFRECEIDAARQISSRSLENASPRSGKQRRVYTEETALASDRIRCNDNVYLSAALCTANYRPSRAYSSPDAS